MAIVEPRCGVVMTAESQRLAATLAARRTALDQALAGLAAEAELLGAVACCLLATLRAGGTVLAVGNGGSAAEAQHFAAELVGRFQRERRPYAALALTADTAILTAVANDYGYAEVFARQVCALGRPGDLLVAFSTSGESENVVRAARAARVRDMRVVALTGARASRLGEAADLVVRVAANDPAVTQELHLVLIHALCDCVEAALAAGAP
ncbi:MAG TPA: SIS domain-containing protein [Chloroflexota bacterium]|nr:SIS domain-containing protein [Chloroflexota bacterium]